MPDTRVSYDRMLVLSFAFAVFLFHVVTNLVTAYGFHRDELYYLACADHLAWGYVDHPPLSIALLWLSRSILGDSLFAVRILPAVSSALVMLLTGIIAAELGGSRRAQLLACCGVLSAPLVLGMDSMFSMNAFDTLFWTWALLLLVRLINSGDTKYWVYLGVVLGCGLLNKISVLWLGVGIVLALLLTVQRRWLLRAGPWIAVGITAALFMPHIVWQVMNGFPTLEFIRNAGSGKYVALSPGDLFLQQTLFMNPLALPLWLGGVLYFLLAKEVRLFRVLPIVYLTVFAILAINVNSKAAYLVTLVPVLFACGGVAMERVVQRVPWRWILPAYAVVIVAAGLLMAPFVVALLPVDTYIHYAARAGVAPSTSESNPLGVLPQHFADMFGWEEFAADVARAWDTLSPDDKRTCAILCGNYGEAGAIDHFGRTYGLPRAISGHNAYWHWGPHGATGDVVIRPGGSLADLERAYLSVTKIGVHRNRYAMPYENDLTIWLCRNRRVPLNTDWDRLRVFN